MSFFNRLRRRGKRVDGVWLSDEQQAILVAVFQGAALRSHRDLEGVKLYLLHLNDDEKREIGRNPVLDLRNKRLLETNHKFPSATFLLTERGNSIAAQLSDSDGSNPLTSRAFVQPN